MQLLNLVNNLLKKDEETEKRDLRIITFAVIPLSTNTGILEWVQGCDTLQDLIQTYRKQNNIQPYGELQLCRDMGGDDRGLMYQNFPLANKLEVFRHVMENTKGEDIQKVLWLNSPNAEVWLERRTTYTRSLATMSIVGYILGLGDRHLSNLMLQRSSGKIVHIDFGDCFEVTQTRPTYPEKIPFR